jgi:hypothetical protein
MTYPQDPTSEPYPQGEQYPQGQPYPLGQQFPPAQPYEQASSGQSPEPTAQQPATTGSPFPPTASQQPYPTYQQPYQAYGQPGQPGQPYAPGYPAQPGYGQPYATYNPAAHTNTMAILSLIFAFVFAPLGAVFGHIARKQIRERGEGGSGLATAGMIVGYVFTGFWVLYCAGFIIFGIVLANNGNTG